MSDRMSGREAIDLLRIDYARLRALAEQKGWQVACQRGLPTMYLRADIEAEALARKLPVATEAAKPSDARERTCLRCRDPFWSQHKGNRLCERCNAVARSMRSAIGG